jgi:polyphenol oxidase
MMEAMLPKPSDGFEWVQATPGPALVCRALEPDAANFFTTRPWPLGTGADDRGTGWADVARTAGVEPGALVRAHLVHGANVVVRRSGDRIDHAGAPLAQADVIVSDDPSLVLAVQTADCVPLLLVDRRSGVVAAAHAGWRGLAAGVPGVAVKRLTSEFGSRPGDLAAAIGPSISAEKYEVDEAVRRGFEINAFSEAQLRAWFLPGVRAGHWQFDGWAAARDQLRAAGVPANRISIAGLCTASHPALLCSYRRDGKAAGRMAAAIRARRR